MSGLSGFGHDPGVRRLPRPGFTGRFPELVSVPGLPGRRSRFGSGPGGTAARDGCGRGVGTSVSCKVTVRALTGRTPPARGVAASRPAARPFPAPPGAQQAASSRVAWRALPSALVGVQPTTVPGVPSRDAGKAATYSRIALPLRRGSVVSTSEAGTDDAGNAACCKAAVPVWRDNGGTTGLAAHCLPGSHGGSNSPLRDDSDELSATPSGGATRRAEGLPVRKKRIVLTALFHTCGFSAAGSGH